MGRQTTLGVDKETSERVHAFKRALGAGSVPDALNEAIDIAEHEGYVDGDGVPTVVSREEFEELEEKHRAMAKEIQRLRDAVRDVDATASPR